MYVPLLILRYLARRRIAWVSLIAVMLCTALVLVVISVMSGWLDMFRGTFKGLSGDVVVRSQGLVGFAHYDDIAAELEALPFVTSAIPAIESLGLANLNEGQIQDAVRVTGLPPDRAHLVGGFARSLFLNNPDPPTPPEEEWEQQVRQSADTLVDAGILTAADLNAYVRDRTAPVIGRASRGDGNPFALPWDPDVYRDRLAHQGRRGTRGPDPATYPGIVVGTGVIGLRPDSSRWNGLWPDNPVPVRMLLLALDPAGGSVDLEQNKAEFTGWVTDNSRTGVFGTDANAVYVDFDFLQRQLRMEETRAYPGGFDDRGEPVGEGVVVPARASKLHVNLAPGADLAVATAEVERVATSVLIRQPGGAAQLANLRVDPWDRQPTVGEFLAAVEKERALIVILFSFVSVVAVFLILCIFYMIVKEKTRDIGILKSLGATSGGVALVFLGYGMAIGLAGGAAGILAGSVFVWNINLVHDALGALTGFEMWSAETYMFDAIPNTVRPREAFAIFVAAVVSSVVGAVVPAALAAAQRPVASLRFE